MDGNVAHLTSMEPVLIEPTISTVNTPASSNDAAATTTTSVVQTCTISDTVTFDDVTKNKVPETVVVPVVERNITGGDPNKRKLDEMIVTDQSTDWTFIETELSQLLDNDIVAKQVIQFLQQSSTSLSGTYDDNNNNNEKFIVLPPLLEKERRKGVHTWVKERLDNIAAADTIENGIIRIWHVKYRSSMPNKIDQYYNNKNSKQRNDNGSSTSNIASAPRDRPYLQFVLYKENMDTGLALQMISQRATAFGSHRGGGRGNHHRSNQKRIRLGYAGNKDKRGITCQYITIPARDTSIKHLCNVFNGSSNNNNKNDAGNKNGGSGHTQNAGVSMIRIGNFQYVKDELRLGRLRGNRFEIALRNVRFDDVSGASTSTAQTDVKRVVLTKAVQDLQENGFINYFGVQRFGKYHSTHMTGLAILRGDFQGAIDTIVCPPMLVEDKTDATADATTHVHGINSSSGGSHKTIRDDAIRTVQLQWKNRFQNVSVDDVPKEELAKIEQNVAKQTLSAMNHYMQSEIAILQSLVRDPLNYEKAFGCINKTMRMMFIHAVQSLLWNQCATYRIDTYGLQVVVGDLVLAHPVENVSDGNKFDNHHEGCPEVKVLTETDVIEKRYNLEDIVLPLIGVKTRNPENSVGTYMNTLLTEKYNIRIEMIEQMEKQRDFHCSGDYRKVICRPSDVQYEIIDYVDELQPFIQTDYMKQKGIDVPHHDSNYNDSLTLKASAVSAEGEQNEEEMKPSSNQLTGLSICFTLPSSAYATICLRELMKRPTCSEYQRELQLGS